MALATQPDVEARLARPLTESEITKADGLLDEASALVRAYLGDDPTVVDLILLTSVVPEDVVIVVSRMVARVIERDASSTSGAEAVTNQVGPFGQTLRFGASTVSGGPWLAAVDKTILAAFRVGGGFVGLDIASDHTGLYRRLV